MRRAHHDQPTLITSAPQNADDEFDHRKKKYAIMMAIRAACVVLAASTYRVSMVLALTFVIAGAVLPWCAVLIANDRPAKRRPTRLTAVTIPPERALAAGTDDRVVDG